MVYMHFSKSLQASKWAITMRSVSIDGFCCYFIFYINSLSKVTKYALINWLFNFKLKINSLFIERFAKISDNAINIQLSSFCLRYWTLIIDHFTQKNIENHLAPFENWMTILYTYIRVWKRLLIKMKTLWVYHFKIEDWKLKVDYIFRFDGKSTVFHVFTKLYNLNFSWF